MHPWGGGAREGGHLNWEEKSAILAEHPATYHATHPFVLLRGDPRLVELTGGYTVVDHIFDCGIAQ